MVRYEDECVDCGKPCLGASCRYRNVPHIYCDICGEEIPYDSSRWIEDINHHYCEICEPDEDDGELCDTCANHYMDDCGWCCIHEGDEGCEFWHEDVKTCALYKEDRD